MIKKWAAILLVLAMCFGLVACTNSSNAMVDPQTDKTSYEELETQLEAITKEQDTATEVDTLSPEFIPKETKDYVDFEGIPDFGAYTGIEPLDIPNSETTYSYSLKNIDSNTRTKIIESYVQELKSRGFYEYDPIIEPLPNEIWLQNDKYEFYAMSLSLFHIAITPKTQQELPVETSIPKPTYTFPADSTPSTGERNALESARQYLNSMAFSYSGLIEQLEYEGFSNSEATYAADNCGADWYEQAALSAKEYLDAMPFSRQGLIEQLEYEGFTYEQAVYAAEQNGY